MSSRLPNYLRAHRKRLGLSQEEVAFLLGRPNGAKVCRYEHFTRQPNLETAFACEVIFHASTRELFLGIYQRINERVVERAKVLSHKIRRHAPTKQALRKREALKRIIGRHSEP